MSLKKMRRPVFACLMVMLVASILSSCGFQLRGSGVESSVEKVHVSATKGTQLVAPLRDRLKTLGVKLVGKSSDPEYHIRLLSDNLNRRAASVTGRALAAEIELTLSLHYQISRAQQSIAVVDQHLEISRIYVIDQNNLVGSSEEQALLIVEMREDLVQQVIRNMNALTRE